MNADDGIVHEPAVEAQRMRNRIADLESALKVIATWAHFRDSQTGADARPDIEQAARRALYPEQAL